EGPPGDFHCCEMTLLADGRAIKLAKAAHSYASNPAGATALIDSNPLTCWSVNGGQGSPHAAILVPEQPISGAKTLTVVLRFEHYYAAGLGRFRLSSTDRPIENLNAALPPPIEHVLAQPAKQSDETALRRYFAGIAPELRSEERRVGKEGRLRRDAGR